MCRKTPPECDTDETTSFRWHFVNVKSAMKLEYKNCNEYVFLLKFRCFEFHHHSFSFIWMKKFTKMFYSSPKKPKYKLDCLHFIVRGTQVPTTELWKKNCVAFKHEMSKTRFISVLLLESSNYNTNKSSKLHGNRSNVSNQRINNNVWLNHQNREGKRNL